MAIITIYSLFGDDIRSVLFDASDDYKFYIMTSISFGFFVVEMVLQSFLREDYWLGFYFWLDLISTLSLLTDIGWIMNALIDAVAISDVKIFKCISDGIFHKKGIEVTRYSIILNGKHKTNYELPRCDAFTKNQWIKSNYITLNWIIFVPNILVEL
jgi:hypothetical protein